MLPRNKMHKYNVIRGATIAEVKARPAKLSRTLGMILGPGP